MRAKVIIISLLTLFFLVSPLIIYGQDSSKSNKRAQKELVKQRKAKGKEARKSDKMAMKSHYKAQGKKTSRRMKRNQKKTTKMKKNKRSPFWESWFN